MTAVTGGHGTLFTSYNSVGSLGSGTVLNTVSVPTPGLYDVEVIAWNTGTTGIAGTDDGNLELKSDPNVAATMVNQSVVPWMPFKIVAGSMPPYPYRIRVQAQSTITLNSIAAGTASVVVASILKVARAN